MSDAFFITGGPKSGTGWFQEYMTTNGTFCFFELTTQLVGGNVEKHINVQYSFTERFSNLDLATLEPQIMRLFTLYPYLLPILEYNLKYLNPIGGISDNGIMPILLALNHYIPNARNLLIVRNGPDIALSLEHQIENHPWHEKLYPDYDTTDAFEIACHEYKRMADTMLYYNDCLDTNKVLIVNFERIFKDLGYLKRIWKFLTKGKIDFNPDRAQILQHKKSHTGIHKKPKGNTIHERWDTFPANKKKIFLELVGEEFMRSIPGYSNFPDIDW